MANVALAVVVAVAGGWVLARVLPKGWFWDRMVLQAAVVGDSGPVGAEAAAAAELVGAAGHACSALRPMGEVEIAGRRHEARAALDALERGDPIRVVGRSGRVLVVEKGGA